MWELPVARGLQYYHCIAASNNFWTTKPDEEARSENSDKCDSLISAIDAMVMENGDED